MNTQVISPQVEVSADQIKGPVTKGQVRPLLLEAFKVQGVRDSARQAGEGLSGRIVKLAVRCGTIGALNSVQALAESIIAEHAFIKELTAEGFAPKFNKKGTKVIMPTAWSGPFSTVKAAFEYAVPLVYTDKTSNKERIQTESALRKLVSQARDAQNKLAYEGGIAERLGSDGAKGLALIAKARECWKAVDSKLDHLSDVDALFAIAGYLEEAAAEAKESAESEVEASGLGMVSEAIVPIGPAAAVTVATSKGSKKKTARKAA